MKKAYETQIRLSDEMVEYVRKVAQETGASMNAVMCILMADGKRLREAAIAVTLQIADLQ